MQPKFGRLLLVLPGWLAFMLYLPTLANGFVWDDVYFLTDLPFLRDPDLWWHQIGRHFLLAPSYFRPLPLISFVVEAKLGGLDPALFHFTNLALHAANTTLVVLLARTLIPASPVVAAGAGLLFAVHPALVENVAWISDRFDLMMLFFLLLALLSESRLRDATARALVPAGLFLLALLCKETAVVLIVLLPLWQMLRLEPQPAWRPRGLLSRGNIAPWAALLAVLGAYLVLRHGVLGHSIRYASEMAPGNGLQHLLLIGKTLGWYSSLLIWPFGQMSPAHPAPTPIATGDLLAWLGLAGVLALAAMLLYLLARRPKYRRPALALGMALVALAPVSNLVPLTIGDNIVQDRYLMLPLVFIVLALAMLWAAHEGRRLIAIPAAAWAIACAITVIGLLPNWASNTSLWGQAYAKAPHSRIAGENYVAALAAEYRDDEAANVARAVLANYPGLASTHHNLAMVLIRAENHAGAEIHARRAIKLYANRDGKDRLDLSEAHNLLGLVLLNQGRRDEAEQALRQAISLTPYLTRPHFNLAKLLYERGDWEAGDRELDIALRYDTAVMAEYHRREGREKKRRMQAKLGQG